MRWQDALKGAARSDFQKYLHQERSTAVERLIQAADGEVLRLQATIQVLDRITAELTRDEREAVADAEQRERSTGRTPRIH